MDPDDVTAPDIKRMDYRLAVIPYGLIPLGVCFALWKVCLPKDYYIYVVSILLASTVARVILYFFLLYRIQHGMKDFNYAIVAFAWTIITVVVFAIIRVFVPFAIASNLVQMAILYLIVHLSMLFIGLIFFKKKKTADGPQ
jgi:hypothetical protein